MNDNAAADPMPSANGPSVRLRLVRRHGNPENAVLSVPTSGATLAAAFELDGQKPSSQQLIEAGLCRIDLQGRSWQLSNDSHSLACALNGARVPAGTNVSLADGDVLEVGLLRFVVELESADANATAFDLRDLASPPAHGRHSGASDDPFGVLDIDGARPQPQSDPLADLLGESPTATRQTVAPASMHLLPVVTAPASRTAPDRADALFDELHEGFVRAVRDPTRDAENAIWETSPALAGETALTTLEDMTRDAVTAYPLVRDMLQKPQTIGQILEGFDTLGRAQILDVDEPDEVLRLFAPELARGTQTSIPSLTRREHHALSPDSPMPIESVRQANKESE